MINIKCNLINSTDIGEPLIQSCLRSESKSYTKNS